MEFYKQINTRFEQVNAQQESKGVNKYGAPLHPRETVDSDTGEKYNMLSMAEEELVDGFKYLQMLREELHQQAEQLEEAINYLEKVGTASLFDEENLLSAMHIIKKLKRRNEQQ